MAKKKLVEKIAGSRNTPEPETKTQLRNEELCVSERSLNAPEREGLVSYL